MDSELSKKAAKKPHQDIESEFKKLVKEWKRETTYLSSVQAMAMHPAYQRIIGMGPQVVPLILKELSRETDHWFWALCAITGENPVNKEDAGNMEAIRKAWLDLGKKRGWL